MWSNERLVYIYFFFILTLVLNLLFYRFKTKFKLSSFMSIITSVKVETRFCTMIVGVMSPGQKKSKYLALYTSVFIFNRLNQFNAVNLSTILNISTKVKKNSDVRQLLSNI